MRRGRIQHLESACCVLACGLTASADPIDALNAQVEAKKRREQEEKLKERAELLDHYSHAGGLPVPAPACATAHRSLLQGVTTNVKDVQQFVDQRGAELRREQTNFDNKYSNTTVVSGGHVVVGTSSVPHTTATHLHLRQLEGSHRALQHVLISSDRRHPLYSIQPRGSE